MALWKPKKIIFIGTQGALLKKIAKENETEVISSINFLETLSMRFIPDLIVTEFLSKEDIMKIRKIDKFTFIPILLATENFTKEEIEATLSFQRILICNSVISCQDIFIEHIKAILTKTKSLLPAKTGAIVKKAIFFIELNINKKITRKLISTELATDQDYLTRVFHKEMGITLWSYISILRLEKSKNLLTYTSLSIKEIAENCGFSNSAYFCNCFKKYFNLSPNEIRSNR